MYRAITEDIEVSVEPQYLEEESMPENGRYFWAYHITIANHGDEIVQLKTRHWTITDGNGQVEEVHGDGVIGAQPVLRPGEQFDYTSGCPLPTTSGIMVGNYAMEREDGRSFLVQVPAFSLDIPDKQRIMN